MSLDYLMAVDPGSTKSAYTITRRDSSRPLMFDKIPNEELLAVLPTLAVEFPCFEAAIEQIQSYNMVVAHAVFETAYWSGRIEQALLDQGHTVTLHPRKDVKLHLCGKVGASDKQVVQALVNRFAPGQANFGKGTKAAPGWFYGFHADVWQAQALAVTVNDRSY